ncbi:hypothetical protein FIBSPDRAFT_261843 [Athelia psychrophila]|uniref:Uncharacterized protein n=1 Tax=Athelia psychrophila TaxID=1759441 RepID=A0A165XHW4_9AGAM|nr:hypothetical protein FIBSPDRAFT_261843 [Fibularhizoctonia sp. CBS 109695]
MHYADVQSFLEISIDLPYPSNIQNCLDPSRGDMQAPASEADLLEDLIWDPWRSLDDEFPLLPDDMPMYRLSARIPVTILGARKYAMNAPSEPPIHYLDPEGGSSPVLFRAAPPSIKDVVFPIAQPIVSVKPKQETLKQMLPPYSPFSPLECAQNYFAGEYAGVLWKKKALARIMTYPPVVEGGEEAKGLKKFNSWLADNMKYTPRAQAPLAVGPL